MNNLTLVKMATFVVIFTFLKIDCLGQKEDNYWPFYDKNSITWNGVQYTIGTSAITKTLNDEVYEGMSSICNKHGNILYYSDGYHLYNKNHSLVDSSFRGCEISATNIAYSSAQGTLFLNSYNNEIIHFFTVGAMTQSDFNYNKLDTNSNVLIKNKSLPHITSEHLNATRHSNGRDWWVITHSDKGNEYYIYLVDDTLNFISSQNIGS